MSLFDKTDTCYVWDCFVLIWQSWLIFISLSRLATSVTLTLKTMPACQLWFSFIYWTMWNVRSMARWRWGCPWWRLWWTCWCRFQQWWCLCLCDGDDDADFGSDGVYMPAIRDSQTPCLSLTLHCFYTAHCTLHTAHCIQHTELNTAQCTLHTEIDSTGMHFIVHTACHSLFTLHCFCTVHFTALILSVQLLCTLSVLLCCETEQGISLN